MNKKIWMLLRIFDVIDTATPTIPLVSNVVVQRLCWHCCHAWNGPIIPFPAYHDELRNTFKVFGQFCSWECIKAYNRDSYAGLRNSLNAVNVRHYYKKLTGSTARFVGAPPRALLREFGGHMTIEEFRGARDQNLSYDFSALNLVAMTPVITTVAAMIDTRKKVHDEHRPVDFASATCKNDNLRMKRPKPLTHAGRNGLERALGLNSLLKKPTA